MSDRTCPICGTKCQRPGKFEGNECQTQAEAIWDISQVEGCDDECGSVADYGFWAGRIDNLEHRSAFGAKAAVVSVDDAGFVTVLVCADAENAEETYQSYVQDVEEMDASRQNDEEMAARSHEEMLNDEYEGEPE